MTFRREYYPDDWEQIALAIKASVSFRCQNCNRPCRKPNESLGAFAIRIEGIPHEDLDWVNRTAYATIFEHPQRFTLTIAHLDQNPENNDPDNLKALCTVCHFEYDRPFIQANTYRNRERDGQLPLPL